jgi:adenylate kinase family enzyme
MSDSAGRWNGIVAPVRRVVVLGPGGSGKSTFARALSARTGIPCTDLDSVYWSSDLEPMPAEEWVGLQKRLCSAPRWILDGDLGPYDVVETRLKLADAVVLLDLPTWLCCWRALRRSRERLDFWLWLLTWRRRYRPKLLRQIEEHAPTAPLLVARSSGEVANLLAHWGEPGRSLP